MASPSTPGFQPTGAAEAARNSPFSLVSVAEKKLAAKCRLHTLTYCPTMDLVALATEDEQVHVFRLNGQRVFGGSYGNLPEATQGDVVRGLKWKENGELELEPFLRFRREFFPVPCHVVLSLIPQCNRPFPRGCLLG